jgi:hypothetical protein
MTSTLIASPADRPRDAEASCGPRRPGYLSESELAARWGRASNTLASWRNRPPAAHDPVPCELFGIYAYYPIVGLWAYEQDPRHARVRPMALRDEPFPPLFTARLEEYSAESLAVMAQLSLSTMDFRDAVLAAKWAAVDFVPTHACREEVRAFNAIHLSAPQTARDTADVETQPELPLEGAYSHVEGTPMPATSITTSVPVRSILAFDIVAGYAIAIDNHDTVWFADTVRGLSDLRWQPVAPLPQPIMRVSATAGATR